MKEIIFSDRMGCVHTKSKIEKDKNMQPEHHVKLAAEPAFSNRIHPPSNVSVGLDQEQHAPRSQASGSNESDRKKAILDMYKIDR